MRPYRKAPGIATEGVENLIEDGIKPTGTNSIARSVELRVLPGKLTIRPRRIT
jgi:hypothetical protein